MCIIWKNWTLNDIFHANTNSLEYTEGATADGAKVKGWKLEAACKLKRGDKAPVIRRHIIVRIRKHRVIGRSVILSVQALNCKTNLLEQHETIACKETKNQEQRKSD
jgi:hypothetical protein